jgi:hypothetical protein
MPKQNNHSKAEDKLGPPPADALARLRLLGALPQVVTPAKLPATPNLGPMVSIIPDQGKQRRGRKRATPISTSSAKKEERIDVETWVPPVAANLLNAVAQAHGLPPGTLINLLARGIAKVKPGRTYPATAIPKKPWHVRWTISRADFAELHACAEIAGQSVGSYCLARALSALGGNPSASVAPLLLTRAEREILAGLHQIISSYTMIVGLNGGTDAVLSKLRPAAEAMAYCGPSESDHGRVEELGHLAEVLIIRGLYGADLTEVKQRIYDVALKFQSP